jgi:non-lysosomal glucosylceramidase
VNNEAAGNVEGQKCCCGSNCGGGIERRDFLRMLAVGTAATMVPAMPILAGPFEAADFEKLVPADKKLDPAWVKSLFARGTRTVYRGAELEKIGMPVGGICAGQVYLGGDGRLWHWDIFNQHIGTGAAHYAQPLKPASPLEQGFAIRVSAAGKTQFRTLDRAGFADVTFCGEYPIGLVEYRDPAAPVTVSLEAFSPFVPLKAEDSSLPATVLRFTIKNAGPEKVDAEFLGWLENGVCLHTGKPGAGQRHNRVLRRPSLLFLDCSAEAALEQPPRIAVREDILFEDFQKETYEGWEVTGTAFGRGPILKSQIPSYQGEVGAKGPRVVNSHASAPGGDVGAKDRETGTLTSKPFVIERNYVTFWIGGGNHPGKTCVNLLVDGKAVLSAAGQNQNQMRRESLDVRRLQGKTARLQIVDAESGPWGNIGVAEIVFSDRPAQPAVRFQEQPDFGTMGLGLLEPQPTDSAAAAVSVAALSEGPLSGAPEAAAPIGKKLVGALARKLSLAAGEAATVTFVVAWHFPNLRLKDGGRFYATRFPSAAAVARHVADNFDSLARQTRLWHDTWYDSTLPYWFLDRTLANTSILATSTCHRFETGRFYGWEGVGCCEGTCTHVWHYAHAVARLFPELERDLRRRTDFGTAMDPRTGVINHRGEGAGLAVDGQAGCILRAYREHQMSADGAFLKALWPKVKLAMQCLVRMDDGKGILAGAQHNTLDQPWFGRVAWLSSLYVAAARASEEMAKEVGDAAFARTMREIADRGGQNIDRDLFDGEYYVHIPDKEHAKSVGSHNGCEIDQVFGQSWAYQVGLGRILDEDHVKKALASLWRYNFTPDVGPFRQRNKPGRWYALAGEGGLIMCTWPKGDAARLQQGFDFYFNECMTGFEYQVAGHMIWEGMVQEGLAVARTIHDRYHAARRNPWNEVECGDHYARAMASYGVFLAACGYQYHGPKGHLAFAPRLTPEDFRAAFTTAEGWGSFSQKREGAAQRNVIDLRWGTLRLRSLALALPEKAKVASVRVVANGAESPSKHRVEDGTLFIELAAETVIQAGQKIEVAIA